MKRHRHVAISLLAPEQMLHVSWSAPLARSPAPLAFSLSLG